jgi:hypothetical protein
MRYTKDEIKKTSLLGTILPVEIIEIDENNL